MEMVVPEILADMRQLSPSLLVSGLVIGVVLTFLGWWSHRFWMVLAFTVLGGLWGMQNAAVVQSQPFVAALGVGMAAGILALTLVRLGAFVAGGYAGLLLMHAAFPSWDQPLLSFLMGGFLGFLLLRYWTMAATSIAGAVLMAHAALALLDQGGKINCVAWSEDNAGVLTTICAVTAAGGFAAQFFFARLRWRGSDDRKGMKKDGKKPKSDTAAALAILRRAG